MEENKHIAKETDSKVTSVISGCGSLCYITACSWMVRARQHTSTHTDTKKKRRLQVVGSSVQTDMPAVEEIGLKAFDHF
jgi:hypothetical protein